MDYDFRSNFWLGTQKMSSFLCFWSVCMQILSTLTCEKYTPTKICKAQGRFFPESSYGKTMAYIQSIENLIATYPDLQNLTECTPIRVAISDVALRQCKPFKTSIRLLWICVLSLSIDLMILTSLLIVKAYQEKGKELSLCSIVPCRHSCWGWLIDIVKCKEIREW